MASVIGKWKIEKSDNFEEYMKAIGVAEQKRAEAHKYLSDGSGMTQEFSNSGDDWTIKTCTASGERENKVTLGQSNDTFTLDGRPIKVVYSVDGDKLVETQTGDGFECSHVRHGSGSTLTMTLTGGGVTCVRTFTKV